MPRRRWGRRGGDNRPPPGISNLAARTDVESQPGIALAAAGKDKHDRPLAAAEDATKSLFVRAAGLGRVAGMRVQPDAGELLRPAACVHLGLEEVGHGQIVKGDAGHGHVLLDAAKLLDPQQVVGCWQCRSRRSRFRPGPGRRAVLPRLCGEKRSTGFGGSTQSLAGLDLGFFGLPRLLLACGSSGGIWSIVVLLFLLTGTLILFQTCLADGPSAVGTSRETA